MASNLAGGVCLGQHSACIVRAALLGPDCAPIGGPDSGIVTTGIVTGTATPETEDDVNFEPQNGCGDTGWTYSRKGKIRRWTITAELLYHDWELKFLLFGGNLILGAVAGPYAGEVIGWEPPDYNDGEEQPSVYFEIITKAVAAGIGECTTAENDYPPYVGHAFGKTQFTPDARTYDFSDGNNLSLNGVVEANPNLGLGPWEDYPGAGVMSRLPHKEFGYSQAQYEAILAEAGCGYADDLPVPAS